MSGYDQGGIHATVTIQLKDLFVQNIKELCHNTYVTQPNVILTTSPIGALSETHRQDIIHLPVNEATHD